MNESEKNIMEDMSKMTKAFKELEENHRSALCGEHTRDIQDLKLQFTKLDGNVNHIKDRLDNGISPSLSKISDTLVQFMPLLQDNTNWINGLKKITWVIVAGSIGFGFWFLQHLISK